MSISDLYQIFKASPKICTDTRNLVSGSIFFCLKGPNFNANHFADQALSEGCIKVVVDEVEFATSNDHILVNDVLTALQELASYHRSQLNIPVIGITGSNGKTTTKELTLKVLEKKFKVGATKGNFNNHIGVPLTILNFDFDTEIALIELGDNKPGDIAELCQIAKPNYGLITNIGLDHIEGYGTYEKNVQTKAELFEYLKRSEGTAIVNQKDLELCKISKENNIEFYNDNNSIFLKEINPYIIYQVNEQIMKSNLVGKYNFENILSAIKIGQLFNVAENDIYDAIKEFKPQNNRSEIIEKGTNTILLDAYNANPSSMEAAITNFSLINTSKKKMAILGDMYELGDISQSEHLKIQDLVLQQNFDKVIFVGSQFEKKEPNVALFFNSHEDVSSYLSEEKLENYFILIKASRGLTLEKITGSI